MASHDRCGFGGMMVTYFPMGYIAIRKILRLFKFHYVHRR